MDRSLRLRTLVLAAILTFCVLYLLPTFVDQDRLPSWFFDNKIQLGLDLQGGAHFVYDIDLNKAVDDKAAEVKRDLDYKLGEKKIQGDVATPNTAPGALAIKLTDQTKRGEIEGLLKADYSDVLSSRPCSAKEKTENAICMRISSKFADNIRRTALKQAVKTVEHRINERGVAEPTVIEKDDQIVVELPGLDEENTTHIKELIARTAKLEFKIVADDSDYMKQVYDHVVGAQQGGETKDPLATSLGVKAYPDQWNTEKKPDVVFYDWFLTAYDRDEATPIADAKKSGCYDKNKTEKDGKVFCKVLGRTILERYLTQLAKDDEKTFSLPDNAQIGYEQVFPDPSQEKGDKRPYWRTYYLDRTVRLTGTAVTDARVDYDPNTYRPEVIVNFNRYGGRLFGDLTGQNVGKKMAIILDDNVESAPIIQTAIRQGVSNITMGGGDAQKQERDARDLVNVLKTGSLPAPLVEKSFAQLGPTLGRDAVAKTQLSFVLGTILVLVIMVSIYRWSGTIAITGIVMNVIMQLTVMAMFKATLTLPGIAALVLTVGMDVDGNILIYERIRDELNLGKSVKGAVDIGFARAFSTILDGHMTTAAAGWVLLQYGTGPIHGFAVLLLVGIGTTLFVNTWVTRLLFDWYISKKKGDLATISI